MFRLLTELEGGAGEVWVEGEEAGKLSGELRGQLNLSRPLLAGHSLGGASVVLALASHPTFHAAIALDSWLFPLRQELDLQDRDSCHVTPASVPNQTSLLDTKNMNDST